jgi:6-phosphogluconolactonase
MSSIAGRAIVEPDPASVAQHAADWLVEKMEASAGTFRLALSGGSTPRLLYRLLAGDPYRARIAWPRLELYWGDERFVPWDDPDSNYRMAKDEWLSRIAPDPAHIHPMPTDTNPEDCARRYEATLKAAYGADTRDPARPLFDVVLLGLGDDGHTASLIPGQPVLDERARWVAPVMKGRDEPRLTLTYPTLESSRAIAFLVTGAGKRDAVRGARNGDMRLPAARLKPLGETLWFLDSAAAG